MIDVYKFLNKKYDTDKPQFTTINPEGKRTRGHSKKIIKQRGKLNTRLNFFSFRVVNQWNDLPEEVINAKSLNAFKNRLDNFWKNKSNKYDPNCYHTY